jgi:hypothetical protein
MTVAEPEPRCVVDGCTLAAYYTTGIKKGLCFLCKASTCIHCDAIIYVRCIPYAEQGNRRRSCDACQRRLRLHAPAYQARTHARAVARSGRTCVVCGTAFESPRSTRVTCSDKCRVARYRHAKRLANSDCESVSVTPSRNAKSHVDSVTDSLSVTSVCNADQRADK